MDRKEFLEKEIRRHDNLFWVEGQPEISDPDYDKLVEELREIDPDNYLVNKINTPEVKGKYKIKHIQPMLSLDKVYSIENLIKWCEKVARNEDEEFLIQLKYDGCSAELAQGVLSTRGDDGIFGDDISNKLVIMEILKNDKPILGTDCIDYVRGEILIKKSKFQEIKDRMGKRKYKTPRNMCAGILNRDDIDTSFGPFLTLVDFNLYSLIFSLKIMKTSLDWAHLIKTFKESQFPSDGIVIKIRDQIYAKSLGETNHHPKSEISLKFANPTGETTLIGVEWSPGKHVLTPIGKVKPVEISGVTISNINLHNFKYIIDNDIHINDTIIVERAGDVIPDVQESYPTDGKERIEITITHCPICNHLVNYIEPVIICSNENCSGKHLAQLIDSVRRIGIERLGEPTLKKMIEDLEVKNLVDVFNVLKDDLFNLERFAESSSDNLFGEIQKVKDNGVFEWQILSSLNLAGIGTTLSKDLLKNRSLEELRRMNVDQFLEVDGIGPERAKMLVEGLSLNSNYIDQLLEILPIKEVSNMNISGMSFVLTGTMPMKRKDIIRMIEDKGGQVKGMTKDTNYLVSSDPESESGKMKTAKEYGTAIISFEELLNMLR